MLLNFIKITIRNIRKNPFLSFINIFGLALAITCSILILQYVIHEWSYDSFHKKSSQIYRAHYETESTNGISRQAKTPAPLAETIETVFPEVVESVRLDLFDFTVKAENQLFKQRFLVTEKSFFSIFDFKLFQGDQESALSGPSNIVLTKKAALKYFGNLDVLGKILELKIGTFKPFTITGIIENPPTNSNIQFEVLLPISTFEDIGSAYTKSSNRSNWGALTAQTYLLVGKGTNISALENKITKHLQDAGDERFFGESRSVKLMNMKHIYLSPEVFGGIYETSNPLYSYILSGIGIFILLIACINFTTLTLGRSEKRTKEIGLRKTFGGTRKEIAIQFNGESFIMATTALIVALVAAEWLQPFFHQITGKEFQVSLSNPTYLLSCGLLVIIVGVLSGLYPALHLSRFEPSEILRGKYSISENPLLMRSLVVLQFCLSVILIIGTIAINKQINLIQNKDLGFNEEQVISINAPSDKGNEIHAILKERLQNNNSIISLSASFEELPSSPGSSKGITTKSGNNEIRSFAFKTDSNFIETLDIEILNDGGNIHRIYNPSQGQIIVNEAFVNTFGWENPIGRKVTMPYNFTNAEIVGVVKNFHFHSLHNEVLPLAINPFPSALSRTTIYAKIAPHSISDALNAIEGIWNSAGIEAIFNFTFLEDRVAQQYFIERRWASVLQTASIFAIIISCFGLFGLVILSARKRKKEIGIRKVLGANISDIIRLLSLDFVKLVLIGFLIAIPIGWYAANQWLQSFAYRIEINFWTFLIAGLMILIIALFTISWQSIRAALMNPIDSLKNE